MTTHPLPSPVLLPAKQIQKFRDEEEVRCGVDGVGMCPGEVVVGEQRVLEFGERAGRVGRERE